MLLNLIGLRLGGVFRSLNSNSLAVEEHEALFLFEMIACNLDDMQNSTAVIN